MNSYKHAPGRNWSQEPRRRRPVNLSRGTRKAGSPKPSSEWYTLGDLKHAAGRNWTRERRPSRTVHLGSGEAPKAVTRYPLRERGGGDHDEPYTYRAPSSRWTFPFTEREYARLLVLRGRLRDEAACIEWELERPGNRRAA